MLSVDIKLRFGAAVRNRRKHLGISQEELAGRAGLHRTYVADVERGARNLSLLSIEKLARALDVSLPALFSQATDGPVSVVDGVVDILLVEDEAGDLELTLGAFEAAHLTNRVHVVRDGAEALEYVFRSGRYADRSAEHRPHVILLDLYLPKVNGLEVLRQIKADKNTHTIPVVVLTGSQREEDVAESLRLGAASYIVKPVNFSGLVGAVPQTKLGWALLRRTGSAA